MSSFGAQDQAERRLLSGFLFVFLQPAQVELHLSLVGSFELAEFQFDRDQPPQATMIEEQIKGVVFAVDHHSLLTSNETEFPSHLQQNGFNVSKNSGL